MLPSVVALELHDAVAGFLRSAFPIATKLFQGAGDGSGHNGPTALISELVEREGVLFKGPYLDIRMPFRRSTEPVPFSGLKLPFQPFSHQFKAFQRLTGTAPKSTLIATGTGSGKTECFMLPVLEHCLRRRQRGIKALVIYPMNALANDQASRFAKEVHKLNTRITVGLYIGGEQGEAHTGMGPDHVITDHKTLRRNPPDILLTNYKMLDFLLIRPKDQPLWRCNNPGTLRYLVVDELHTFDGAQGTDLACLIRRLRKRLGAGDELACVGTSATMGSGSSAELLDYARKVFASDFDTDALIGEDRLSVDEYLRDESDGNTASTPSQRQYFQWPDPEDPRLDPDGYNTMPAYLTDQARMWFEGAPKIDISGLQSESKLAQSKAAVCLGAALREHQAFHQLLRTASDLTNLVELANEWRQRMNLDSERTALNLLSSLLTLIAAARLWIDPDRQDTGCAPFLQVRLQLWLRELRRMVCSVPMGDSHATTLQFADDLKDPLSPLHLPLVHCRECHMAAWGAVQKHGDPHLTCELQTFYHEWFGYSPQARLLIPVADEDTARKGVKRFCPACLRLQSGHTNAACDECGHEGVQVVWVPDMVRQRQRHGATTNEGDHSCPECGAADSLAVLGYRAATLTSVMVGRLFSTPYNDDFKLIAFSDSVQDAAHRAGFLGANNWRVLLRQAMTSWLQQQENVVDLETMRNQLPTYLREQMGSAKRFCGMFTAPDIEFTDGYRGLEENGELPAGSKLPEMVSKRLAWECLAEFGRRGILGRSLERTGTAAIGLDIDRLQADIEKLVMSLREEVEALRGVSMDEVLQFVVGWLHHMRQLGAMYAPVLDGYLTNKGRDYLLNRILWMPGFARAHRPPAAISLGHLSTNFEALVLGNRDTWSVRWLKKTLASEKVFAAAEARQIFHLLLRELHRGGWLHEHPCAGDVVYLLEPGRLQVGSEVAVAHCDRCRHAVHFAADLADVYAHMACPRSSCMGRLSVSQPQHRVPAFGRSQPRRLVPHEHTGLLSRDAREHVESSFIHGQEPWDYNLLSATPTLEMGIDIGALSSIFLCSVPPAQANYLQRIGRAGRHDGNSLAVTVANGRNHDLFFYADPREMIAGQVHTPGVFLQAIAVLERQLIAYCFDCWAASGIDESAIPGKLRPVLNAAENGQLDHFPYTLFNFVQAKRADILGGFFSLFDSLSDEAREYLAAFLSSTNKDSLQAHLLERLARLNNQRASFNKQVKELKRELDRLRKQPDDEATRDLLKSVERERSALLALMSSINARQTLNFFTDEGLLPNYAFPEEGVTLQSVILRRKSREQSEDGRSSYETVSYSFQRPAQAALGELAPDATFYAISHRLTIDQVDLQLSEPEDWRFCDRCQYCANVAREDQHSACPRCGSPQWGNIGQKHQVLRLRQVYSTVSDRRARIGDDSEQREPVFFNRQMLVDIPAGGNHGGWRLKSEQLPFGFEFLNKVTLREVNFGLRGGQSNVFSVAGEEQPRRGFRLCRHCGKVQKERPRANEKLHTYACPLYRHPEQASDEDFLESLYLYRELESEAIRILLPLSEVAYSDVKLDSFVAALNLGLKRHFRGEVHHLLVTQMREPASEGSGERLYLLIYDRIPGGTGYLKDLMRAPEVLFDVLAQAHQHLLTCECVKDERLDGCYRCLLAYRDSRNMPTISRHAAAELLGDILKLRDQVEPVASLGEISTNALIESKLEQKFVDALGRLDGAQMSHEVFHGKNGHLLTLPGASGRPVAWHVEHQVKVGPAQGVAANTEIDVLLSPARSEDARTYRPIAVYMDGFQYHHDIVDKDVYKRMALRLSDRYWVVSLNWDDLPDPGQMAKPIEHDLMRIRGPQQSLLEKIYATMCNVDPAPAPADSMQWFSTWLRDPGFAAHAGAADALRRGFTLLRPPGATGASIRSALAEEMHRIAPPQVVQAMDAGSPQTTVGGVCETLCGHRSENSMVISLPQNVMQAALEEREADGIAEVLHCHLCFDDHNTSPNDDFKAQWRAFWYAANRFQFAPGFSMATCSAVENGQMDQLWSGAASLRDAQTPPAGLGAGKLDADWQEVADLSSLDKDLLASLRKLGLPAPEVGMDLTDTDGQVVLSGDKAELVWPVAHVVVCLAAVNAVPEPWRLIPADGALLDSLGELKQHGAFA